MIDPNWGGEAPNCARAELLKGGVQSMSARKANPKHECPHSTANTRWSGMSFWLRGWHGAALGLQSPGLLEA